MRDVKVKLWVNASKHLYVVKASITCAVVYYAVELKLYRSSVFNNLLCCKSQIVCKKRYSVLCCKSYIVSNNNNNNNNNNNKNDDFYSAVTWRKAIIKALTYATR